MTANTTAESWPEIQRPTSRPLSARLQHCGKKIFSTMTSAQCSDYSSSDDLRTRRKERQVRWPLHVSLLSTIVLLLSQPSLWLYLFLLKIKIFHLTNIIIILFCFLRRPFFNSKQWIYNHTVNLLKKIFLVMLYFFYCHSCEILRHSSIS